MSVLACERSCCEEIMCTRMILEASVYICDRCWRELLADKCSWPARMTATEVRSRIEAFMRSPAKIRIMGDGDPCLSPEQRDREFERLTGS